jgi:hypothetical protein
MSEIGAGSALPVAAVRVAPPGLRSDMRAARVVWQRELIRFGQDRIRIVAALVQPVLFLFVLGTGLQSLTSASTGDRTCPFAALFDVRLAERDFVAASGDAFLVEQFGHVVEALRFEENYRVAA